MESVTHENLGTKNTNISADNVKRLKENAKKTKELKEKLVSQVEHNKEVEFASFSEGQKDNKGSFRKTILVMTLCLVIVFSAGVVIYSTIFAADSFLRDIELGKTTFDEVISNEKTKLDSGEPDSGMKEFGMLVYYGVDYEGLTGDTWYYFNTVNNTVDSIQVNFDNNESNYDKIVSLLEDEFGKYTLEEYSELYPSTPVWKVDGGMKINILKSQEEGKIKVVVERDFDYLFEKL